MSHKLDSHSKSTGRRLARAIIERVPFKRRLLITGAKLSPALRAAWTFRLCSAFATSLDFQDELVTNLGIHSKFECLIPGAKHFLVFGKPALYVGETGALYLAGLLAKRCDSFVDIGANYGYFIFYVLARPSPVINTYFFEPDPMLFQRLSANIKRNHLNNVTGYPAAVGSFDGHSEFFQNLTDDASGSLAGPFLSVHNTRAIEVTVKRFDSFAQETALSNALVKVDVENGEFEFLLGAGSAMERIKYLIMEVLGPAHQRGFVQTMIREVGLHAYYINHLNLEYSPDGSFAYIPAQYNWLFTTESPESLGRQLRGSSLKIVYAA